MTKIGLHIPLIKWVITQCLLTIRKQLLASQHKQNILVTKHHNQILIPQFHQLTMTSLSSKITNALLITMLVYFHLLVLLYQVKTVFHIRHRLVSLPHQMQAQDMVLLNLLQIFIIELTLMFLKLRICTINLKHSNIKMLLPILKPHHHLKREIHLLVIL